MTTQGASPSAPQRAQLMTLLLVIGVTLAIHFVPYGDLIGRPLVWLSTFVHEMGHGVAALLVGGRFEKFLMWADGSGVAWTRIPTGGLQRAIVSAGGLLGPAIMAGGLLVLATRPRWARVTLWTLAAICGLSLLLVVRNLFGFTFVLGCALLLAAIARFGSDRVTHFALMFLGVQLALSVYSRGDYLFTPTANTATGTAPSDVQNMADALFGPWWFWGGLIALLSAAILLGAGYYYVTRLVRSGDR